MIIFRIQLLCILLIGSHRLEATKTSAGSSSASQSQNGPKEHDKSSNGIGEKVHTHHWDCQPDSQSFQEQISLTTKLLQDGDEFVKKQNNFSEDETVVLVIGKAGASKSNLVKFLTGIDKLVSKEIHTGTGEYIYEDTTKKSSSIAAVNPEFIKYNSTFNYCVTPRFHDSISSAHEIVSMNIMKSIANKIKKTKILLVENYESLKFGQSEDNFMETLRYVDDFIVDIDKYKDHLAIIVARTPLTYRSTDDINIASGIVTDEMHIAGIANYLNHLEKFIGDKLKLKISKSEEEFYRRAIRLLQSLQSRDKNGQTTRINIFRQPYKSGSPKAMQLLVKNRESLLHTITSLNSIHVSLNDFDYVLSNQAKIYLQCMLDLINDSYKNETSKLSLKLIEHLSNETQSYENFNEIIFYLKKLHGSLKRLSQGLDRSNNDDEYFGLVHGFIADQKIPIQYNGNTSLKFPGRYEDLMMDFVNKNRLFNPSSWTAPIRKVIEKTEDELEWYETLNKFIEELSGYEIQKMKNKFEMGRRLLHENSTVDNNDLLMHVWDIYGNKFIKQLKEASGDSRRKKEVELITNSLLKESNITCDSNGTLIVRGYLVRLSEINSEKLVREHCNNTKLKEVGLLAVDTVFFDEDTDDIFKGVNMVISAPKWKVIGEKRRIVLSGEDGSKMPGNPYVADSKDGAPGLPGGSGGSFFGLGYEFSKGEDLTIESNGGRGGPGADGAKGEKGADGRDGAEKAMEQFILNSTPDSAPMLDSTSYVHLAHNVREPSLEILFDNKTDNLKEMVFKNEKQCAEPIYSDGGSIYYNCSEVYLRLFSFTENGDCGSIGGSGGLGGEGEREVCQVNRLW
ncbi:uncharacterized protein LOC120350940 [Nilaparvata lugens]|uniref:uncharacterized protein LOC120350940 n=1 Tax=Nilaparvata lugens TaxID=108931 RepID=UPI00193D8FF1|nr:uncharacterized protein LOC120350940 [Nilaparvata lugens]